MNYLEDFLTNKMYKLFSIFAGFIFILFIDLNNNSYNYLQDDQNTTIDQNITLYNNIDNIDTNDYNRTITHDVYDCNKVLYCIYNYRSINSVITSIILILLGTLNFQLLEMRKKFCTMLSFIVYINIIWQSFIIAIEYYNKCLNIINNQYEYVQTSFLLNYLIMFILLVVFGCSCKSNLTNTDNNDDNDENDDVTIDIIENNYSKLPNYSEINTIYVEPLQIVSDVPPPKYEDNNINLTQPVTQPVTQSAITQQNSTDFQSVI